MWTYPLANVSPHEAHSLTKEFPCVKTPPLTKEASSCKADIGNGLLEELGYDHVSVLILLLPA